jgi:hypothetical protein
MTRAALVAGVLAVAASLPSAGLAAPAAGSTFVVRGIVVQYIPPSGSVVGSLSIRVVKAGARGRALLGELVTVAVEPGDSSKTGQLLRSNAFCTVTLNASSPASILNGAADVRSIVAGPPAALPANADPTDGTAPGTSDSAGNAATGDRGSSQAGDHRQNGDHGTGQGNGASQGRNGGGGSHGHK